MMTMSGKFSKFGGLAICLLAFIITEKACALSSSSVDVVERLQKTLVTNAQTGQTCNVLPLADIDSQQEPKRMSLVVVLPQLGEFDSAEFCEHLVAASSALDDNGIDLRVVGIGNTDCAKQFSDFTGLPLDCLMVDPDGSLHQELNLHAGPGWAVPEFVSDDVLTFLLNTLPGGAPSLQNDNDSTLLRRTGKAWLNYLAMCAGLGAPGTLQEILRGYFGDKTAPERFSLTDVVKAGFITIGPGVGPVQMGPIQYTQWWADERGYQRPIELATIRLKNMVEVLTKWDDYVTNPTTIDRRGATYLVDNASGELMYEYKHRGVLTYSETMARPLSFLAPYIGEEIARNPLGLPDYGDQDSNESARGLLKPAGKFMSLLKPLFAFENKLQAQLLGADEADFQAARQEIEQTISNNHVVIYTYGLSPFSSQAVALLESSGCTDYKQIELGLEWFLLGKEASATRAELLALTGQSSLPHVFIGGKHIGGLFSGTDEGSPGLAALQESGKLKDMLLGNASATSTKPSEASKDKTSV